MGLAFCGVLGKVTLYIRPVGRRFVCILLRVLCLQTPYPEVHSQGLLGDQFSQAALLGYSVYCGGS